MVNGDKEEGDPKHVIFAVALFLSDPLEKSPVSLQDT